MSTISRQINTGRFGVLPLDDVLFAPKFAPGSSAENFTPGKDLNKQKRKF
ncbi:MAG: hypothetical protein ACI9C4_002887 [Paraglaciecola sp.]|jgi:hypothetical protein